MGHKVGSLTLHAGVAGGADIILIPEIPYDIKKVTAAIQKRAKAGKRFTILAVAEGAISKEDAELPKKKYKEKKVSTNPRIPLPGRHALKRDLSLMNLFFGIYFLFTLIKKAVFFPTAPPLMKSCPSVWIIPGSFWK